MDKKKFAIIILLSISLVGCSSNKEIPESAKPITQSGDEEREENRPSPDSMALHSKKANSERILENLEYVCKSPRKSGSDESVEIIAWLEKTLTNYGYPVHRQEFDVYRKSLETERKGDYGDLNPYNEKEPHHQSANVIAVKDAEIKTDKTLVVSAHYDTTSNTKGVIDNGSGVAAVLEIAAVLENYPLPFRIVFIFFGCEEYYLTGSKYYLSQLSDKERENIIGCINIDMIGDAELDQAILGTRDGTENVLTLKLLDHDKEPSLLKTWCSIGVSDDVSFDRWNIPSVLVSDIKINPKWTGKDCPISGISIERLEEIINSLCDKIAGIPVDDKNLQTSKSNVDLKGIDSIYRAEDIVNDPLPGYELASLEEVLLESKMAGQLKYLFQNDKKESYEILQQYENPYTEQFSQTTEDYLLMKEKGSYKLVIDVNGGSYITQIIGNMSQIRQLAKIWDINV